MKFNVTVRKEDGTEEKRIVEAPNRFSIYSDIEKEGAAVVAIEEEKKNALASLQGISFGSGVKLEERITFTKNLSAMLAAGLTLSRALSVIERQSSNRFLKKTVMSLEEKVKAGAAFHEALAEHPKLFPKLFVAMTRAGEEGGTLSDALKVIAKQMERSYTLTKKVRGAMIYPSIIVAAVIIIGILMLMFVVPTLSSTFESLGVQLPLATRVIVAMSKFMATHVIVVVFGLVAVVTAGALFFRSRPGQKLVLFSSLHMPVIGELVRETMSARAARTLASLLGSGVEMLVALQITAEVVGENVFGRVVEEAQTRVRNGEQLSAPFGEHPKLYPIFFSDMIAVGEETGKVADMLSQVAEYYETDVEDRTKDLSTIIEPLLMLFIGVFVGIFAISMIAPIYSLSSAIG